MTRIATRTADRMRWQRDFSRRDVLKCALGAALGVSCSGWLPRLARAAATAKTPTSCILLWMSGGPSQLDTFDPKPGHANGGPVKSIATAVPGIHISEYLPKVAAQMQELAIVRSLTTREGDHSRASDLMLTGFRPQMGTNYPSLGSLIANELGDASNELPNYISLSPNRFGQAGGPGFLGPAYAPLVVSGNSDDPTARANLSIENLLPPASVSERSLDNRFKLLAGLEQDFVKRYGGEASESHAANVERAARMIDSQAKRAFQLNDEPAAMRDAYGRNRFGQGCLLARRLVERGVSFVEVTLSSTPDASVGWDTHSDNFNNVKSLCDVLDPAWATLMVDLKQRGLLESTLVIWMGEFGRTPQINTTTGRDHFPGAWSTVLGGAGIGGGQVVGDTGPDGMAVVDRPVTVAELYATICKSLKIDHEKDNYTPEGRPIGIVDEGGQPISELVG